MPYGQAYHIYHTSAMSHELMNILPCHMPKYSIRRAPFVPNKYRYAEEHAHECHATCAAWHLGIMTRQGNGNAPKQPFLVTTEWLELGIGTRKCCHTHYPHVKNQSSPLTMHLNCDHIQQGLGMLLAYSALSTIRQFKTHWTSAENMLKNNLLHSPPLWIQTCAHLPGGYTKKRCQNLRSSKGMRTPASLHHQLRNHPH